MDSPDIPENGKETFNPERVRMGYIVSVASGILIILQGIVRILFGRWTIFLGIGELAKNRLSGPSFTILGIVTVVLGIVILIGAFLIRVGRAREGAITVFAFAILSVFTGGGYLAGLLLGVIGGALVLSKR